MNALANQGSFRPSASTPVAVPSQSADAWRTPDFLRQQRAHFLRMARFRRHTPLFSSTLKIAREYGRELRATR